MALEADDKKEIGDMIGSALNPIAEALKGLSDKKGDDGNKGGGDGNGKPGGAGDKGDGKGKDGDPRDYNAEIEAKRKAEAEAKAREEEIASTVRFNDNIMDTIKECTGMFADTLPEALQNIDASNGGDELQRANEKRKTVIDAFIKLQDNLDLLPEKHKNMANEYSKLSTVEKIKQSGKFYDIIEVGKAAFKQKLKAEALQKEKEGDQFGSGSDGQKEYNKRFLDYSKDGYKDFVRKPVR